MSTNGLFKLSYTAEDINRRLGQIDNLAKKTEIPKSTSDLENNSDFATYKQVQEYAQPKGDYALKKDIPTDYLKSIPDEYVTKFDLEDKGYLTEHQDISGKLNISDLPQAINTALLQAKNSGDFQGDKGDRGKSAYEYARDAGYTGSAADFERNMAREVPTITQEMGTSPDLVMSQDAITKAFNSLTTLPYGGSKEWLEVNGEKSQLYQIDGYIWGFIESEGWVKGNNKFIIVSSVNDMVNQDGTEYLLRSNNTGIVYSYNEATGDVGIPVYDTLPTSANNGDIVAVNGKKYKATVETKEVLAYTNLADPSSADWKAGYRLNSSGGITETAGVDVTNFIGPIVEGDIIRIQGMDMTSNNSYPVKSDKTLTSQGITKLSSWSNSNIATNIVATTTGGQLTVGNLAQQQNGYWRFSGKLNSTADNVIITINEEIGTTIETVVTWEVIGNYTAPTEAGWKATEISYPILDSLPENMATGITVVYSGDGWVWSYLKANDWIRSERKFEIVSTKNEMTKNGGINYLLQEGDTGTVYIYSEPTGDVGIPVHDTLPTSANNGDIVAVNGRKYKAKLVETEVPAYTNLANPSSADWQIGHRLNSSGVAVEEASIDVSNYIPCKLNDVVRIKGYNGGLSGLRASWYYDSSKKTLGSTYPASDNFNNFSYDSSSQTATFIAGRYGTKEPEWTDKATAFARFSIHYLSGFSANNIIITVNEEIKNRIESIPQWEDIGEYVPPSTSKWEATEEHYRIVSSLPATAFGGDQVVYNLDSYLYFYFTGADWMSISKYDPLKTTLDDKLSSTSTNAVQNKVITIELNNIKQNVEKNQDDILTLKNKINSGVSNDSNTGYSIPTYWESSIQDKINIVKNLQTQGGKNCVSFVWASDTHIPDNHNTRTDDLGKLMATMMDNCEIPFALITGDINTRASFAEESGLLDCIAQIPNHLFPLWGTDRLLIALGNHDGSWGDSSGYYRKQFHPDKMWQIFFRGQALDFRRVFSEDGLYYYVDNIPQKMRFIVLNSQFAGEYALDENGWAVNNRMGTACYGQEQLNWLANVALDMPEGYGAILSAHISDSIDQSQLIGIVDAYNHKTSFSGKFTGGVDGWSNSTINVNFSTAKGEIIAMFAGHIHWDRINTTSMSCPIIRILSAGAPENAHQMEAGAVAPVRTKGTDTETSFDVVTINRATRTIYCTRVGGGSHREVSY